MCDKCKIYKSFTNYLYCPICAAPLITNSNSEENTKSNFNTIYSDNGPIEIEYSHKTNSERNIDYV